MSCFYILCTPWPVACLKAEAESVFTAAVCVCVWACAPVCVCSPLAPPGSPALLFQPGVSKFWFPPGLSGNWKQRLSLEVCFVFVCTCMCLCECAVCAFVHRAYACMHLFSRISLCVGVQTDTLCLCVQVWPCQCRETSQRQHGGWIKIERWESCQSLLHMQSWRHGLRPSKCLAIYKKWCPSHSERRKTTI